jgi:hypothetical protein
MPSSEARILANQQNALKSTGPTTPEGKEQSRRNALKHGLTGAGIVVPVEDLAEVERRFTAFQTELQPPGELGLALVKRAATLSVRMERSAEREITASAERVSRAMVEVEIPHGTDEAQATRLRAEAGRLAAFDPSKEAVLARRYEAAAERGFFRALRELRLLEKHPKAVEPAPEPTAELESLRQVVGSFLEMRREDQEFAAAYPDLALPDIKNPYDQVIDAHLARFGTVYDLPITVGKGR